MAFRVRFYCHVQLLKTDHWLKDQDALKWMLDVQSDGENGSSVGDELDLRNDEMSPWSDHDAVPKHETHQAAKRSREGGQGEVEKSFYLFLMAEQVGKFICFIYVLQAVRNKIKFKLSFSKQHKIWKNSMWDKSSQSIKLFLYRALQQWLLSQRAFH